MIGDAQPPFLVVGVGASAGGISALQALFQAIPIGAPLAFVIVQHSLPEHESQLARLFAGWTSFAVHDAEDATVIEPGCVYVAPTGRKLGIEAGRFTTQPLASPRSAGIDTVDAFFESLAAIHGPRAVAVILSGTGSDGAAGATRVRQAGGLVLVQDPHTAMFSGMPNAAIASGAADHILPLGALAQELVASAAPGYVRSTSAASWAEDFTKSIDGILDQIRTRTGVDFSSYRTTPLVWRIQHRMQVRRVPLFRDYEALLHDDATELETLIRGMPIHVTAFFRDPEVWEALARGVLPTLAERGEQVRVWTPACSSGEEAYSLAILLAEHEANFQVFATDVSPEIVARAGRGLFAASTISGLSPERRARFFYTVDGALRVKRSLRERMVFAPQDLLADAPLGDLHLITCRNLLIYLEPDAVRRVLARLHAALRPGGYLVLGASESVAPVQRGFEPVGAHIYRKSDQPLGGEALPRVQPVPSRTVAAARSQVAALEENELPGVLVDEHLGLLRIYGDTSGVLRFRTREPTLDLLQLLPSSVAHRLPRIAQQAHAERRAITMSAPSDGSDAVLEIRVTPMPPVGEQGARFLLTFLGDMPALPRSPDQLAWSEALRHSNAELDASRQELQALNEELRAANDLLNHSNEELNRANGNLRDKLEELETQSNVLSSGAVTTLFLDTELRLRFYTPGVSELFPLRAGDEGRRITDLAPSFHDTGFVDRVRTVMATGEPSEAEVRTFAQRWYLERIRPFHTRGATARTGVAITFTDVTDRKHVAEALVRSEAVLRGNQAWLAAQNEAFQAAMNGGSLATSLGILIRTVRDHAETERRCAFYIADANGETLHHVVGMPDAYARCVDGFRIAPDSLACGLAVATGEPVLTRDVVEEPRWKPWLWLARDYNYRGCWSFPVETSAGKRVGSFEMYLAEPRSPTVRDRELAAALTHTAAIIISRHRT